MKGFIHIYECDEKLENDFKLFCDNNSCGRYNGGLKFLLEFHKTFKTVIKKQEIKEETKSDVKTFGGNSIKLKEDEDKK